MSNSFCYSIIRCLNRTIILNTQVDNIRVKQNMGCIQGTNEIIFASSLSICILSRFMLCPLLHVDLYACLYSLMYDSVFLWLCASVCAYVCVYSVFVSDMYVIPRKVTQLIRT